MGKNPCQGPAPEYILFAIASDDPIPTQTHP